MTPNTREARIAEANAILATMGDEKRFELRRGRLWIATRYGEAGAVLNCTGRELGCDYGRLGMGGTEALAVGQLVRWVRGQTRAPMRCWEYWCSERIKLGNIDTVRLLAASSYPDAKLTACVLCGEENPRTLDWWHSPDGKVVGPCHLGGQCERYRRVAVCEQARA